MKSASIYRKLDHGSPWWAFGGRGGGSFSGRNSPGVRGLAFQTRNPPAQHFTHKCTVYVSVRVQSFPEHKVSQNYPCMHITI